MRDAVGSTWVFGLVITFTLIFAAFLALALTYAKAYRMKNEMATIIEKYEGITTNDNLSNMGSVSIINQYLKNNGYKAKGSCKIGEYGADSLDSNTLSLVSNTGTQYHYCITYETNTYYKCTFIFKLRVFYDFNLPVLGQIRKFAINGQTNELYSAFFFNKELTC